MRHKKGVVQYPSTHLYLINFSYSIHYPSDKKWGSQDENGTWNGLVMEAAKKVNF